MEKQKKLKLRDYFAGQALQGELASQSENSTWVKPDLLSKRCYAIADAMMIERIKNKHIKTINS